MLTQHLSGQMLRDPVSPGAAHLSAIHALPNPPLVPLKADDLFVRRCRLASDAVDSRYGRFRTDDLPRLLQLVRGAPVLIGHDQRTLGVARFFGGTIERRGEHSWIVPEFYWPRAHSGAEDLRVMIDSGVYSEASVAFVYRMPTCSVCGHDIRGCAHWPGRSYDGQLCFFYYDGVERITEGSLVYRGAAHGTGFELPTASAREHASAGDALSSDDDAAVSSPPGPEDAGPTLTIKHHGKRYLALLRPLAD